MLCVSVRVHVVAYICKNTFTHAYAYVTFLSFCVMTPARCISPSCRGEWETVSGFTELMSNREQWIVTILSLQFWLLLESPHAGGQDPPRPRPVSHPGPWPGRYSSVACLPCHTVYAVNKRLWVLSSWGKISVCVLGRWNVLGDILRTSLRHRESRGSNSGGKKLA